MRKFSFFLLFQFRDSYDVSFFLSFFYYLYFSKTFDHELFLFNYNSNLEGFKHLYPRLLGKDIKGYDISLWKSENALYLL